MVGVESISPPTLVQEGTPKELIGAETDLNLFTVQYDPSSAAGRLEDAGNLSPRGSFHLGEMVSRFRHGSSISSFKSEELS
jgi:DNA damage-binding protein 1